LLERSSKKGKDRLFLLYEQVFKPLISGKLQFEKNRRLLKGKTKKDTNWAGKLSRRYGGDK